jgi:hypothetical protein
MVKLIGELLKFPFAALAYGMEAMAAAMTEMRRLGERGLEEMVGGATRALNGGPGGQPPRQDGRKLETAGNKVAREVTAVSDQDLGGDDLKYVTYSILFTKRDLEVTLEREQQDVVNYSTDGGSYGALKIAHFMAKVGAGKVKRPKVWQDNHYPRGAQGDTFHEFPGDDDKYITFVYSVDRRLARQEAQYDKDQVAVLREIRDEIRDRF